MIRKLAAYSLLASLPAGLCSTIPAQGPTTPQTIQFHDVAPLLRPFPGIQRKFDTPGHFILPTGWVTPATSDTSGFSGFEENQFAQTEVCSYPSLLPVLEVEHIQSLLTDIVQDNEFRLLEQRFALRAAPAVHDAVRSRLEEVNALMRQELSLDVYQLDIVPEAAVLDPLTAQQLKDIGTQVLARTLFADVPDFIHSGQSIAYVRDFDVEVAQESKIADPQLDSLFSGHRLGIAVTPLADDRWLVRFGLNHSDVQHLAAENDLGSENGTIQCPSVGVSEARTTAVIENGGGIVITAASPGQRDSSGLETYLVVVGKSPGGAPLPQAVVALGTATTPTIPADPLRDAIENSESNRGLFGGRVSVSIPDLDGYLDFVTDGFVGAQESPPSIIGTYAWIEDDDARAVVESQARAESAGLRTRSVRWACGSVQRTLWDPTKGGDLSQLAASLPFRGVLPVLAGHPFQSARGTEHSLLIDYEVEIAQEAVCGNPIVGRAFDGVSLSGFLRDGGDDGLMLESTWRWSAASVGTSRPVGTKRLGNIHLPSVATTDAASSQRITAGEWTVLNAQPDPRDPNNVVLMMARVK